jgi:hypothetical protein
MLSRSQERKVRSLARWSRTSEEVLGMRRGAFQGVERNSFQGCGGDFLSLLEGQICLWVRIAPQTYSLTSNGLDRKRLQTGS